MFEILKIIENVRHILDKCALVSANVKNKFCEAIIDPILIVGTRTELFGIYHTFRTGVGVQSRIYKYTVSVADPGSLSCILIFFHRSRIQQEQKE